MSEFGHEGFKPSQDEFTPRDELLISKDAEIAAFQDRLAEKDAQLAEKDKIIRELYNHGAQDLSQSERNVIEREREIERITNELNLDRLTGVLNRHGVKAEYDKLFPEKSKRKQYQYRNSVPAGIIFFFDLDNFKDVNDSLGHDTGDQALIDVFNTVKATLRDRDILGRFAGDEGIGILPRTTKEEAETVIERIRQSITEISEVNGHPVSLSISVGVCNIDPSLPFDEAWKDSDSALLEAKNNGRNQVQFANS